MPDPRSLLRGLPELAAAIDRRIKREIVRRLQPRLDIRHVGASAPDAPLSSGASIGGGGTESDSPAYPESFSPVDASYLVLSASTGLASERILTAGSGVALSDAGAGSSATLAVDSTVIRTSGAQNISGTKTFADAPELSSFLRLAEQSGVPAGTPSQEAWLYARDAPSGLPGGRLYLKDSAAVGHDLCVQSSQVFPASQSDVGNAAAAVGLPWAATSFAPSGAIVSQSSVTASSHGETAGFNFAAAGTNAAATSGALFGRWEWTSSFTSAPPIDSWQNAQLAIGTVLRRCGGCATVKARLRVNNTARFSAIYLGLNDADNQLNKRSTILASSLSNNTWYEAELADVNITGWSGNMRVLLTVQGTLNSSNTGASEVDLEWIMVEQWSS